MSTFTYNGADNSLIIGGQEIVGLADAEDTVSIVYESDLTEDRRDITGRQTVRWLLNNLAADISVTLEISSDSNAYLNGLAEADRLTGTGLGVFLFSTGGNTTYTAENCWIKTLPDFNYGTAPSTFTWVIRADYLTRVIVK